MEFVYLVFTHMLGESYRRLLRFLLSYLCYVFRALMLLFLLLFKNQGFLYIWILGLMRTFNSIHK